MLGRIAVKLSIFLLKHARTSYEDRACLTNQILDTLYALPLRDIITINEVGQITVHGREVDVETARALRESAKTALSSTSLDLIRSQVAYAAVTAGVHKAEMPEQILFGKAAIWWGQQEKALLELMAGDTTANSPLSGDY